MFSQHSQLSPNSHFTAIVMIPAIIYTLIFTLPSTLASAYGFNPTNMLSMDAAQHQQQHPYQQRKPTSALASKVLFHSPSLANIYKDMIVSSKPLHLRKHGNGPKAKKTKKDSKIYYIPIPPMPYRYIPGVGLDYQPMKINPILHEVPLALSSMAPNSMAGLNQLAHVSSGNAGGSKISSNHHTSLNQMSENNHIPVGKESAHHGSASKNEIDVSASGPTAGNVAGESKVYRMHRGDYYFNGRPFRLQVAHAQPKNQLTPLNLKSKLYFNKKIIY
ncbi:uncharacterized protein LOC129252988 [Anastrepha obliqua]|uniref:uncharacterized protein LOC129252988 n=1 Tax=Anastrepha obliqua TaxID=95512 RepID=UPI0024091174|nr:uncharacterized protein LOC129252988 [Anastrepha obliqua]XP_054747173.1 uncharacterized protein LOC129252988 [Anastrepha obliqua]